MNPVLEAAIAAYDAGLSVLPAKTDGSKRPRSLIVPADCDHARCVAKRAAAAPDAAYGWKHYTHARLDRDRLDPLFRNAQGMCVITGTISGNLLMLEADEDTAAARLRAECVRAGIRDLMDRIDTGWRELSPRGTDHWFFRIALPDGQAMPRNTPLARRLKEPHEMTDEHDKVQVLLETRGDNGQSVAAPSHGPTHPSGEPYIRVLGGPATVPTLSWAEWQMLEAAARRVDRMPAKPARSKTTNPLNALAQLAKRSSDDDDSIADWFNATTEWSELLTRHGWHDLGDEVTGEEGDTGTHWSRPGKNPRGISALAYDNGPIYIHTTSTNFDPEKAYTKFQAYAILEHGGAYTKAASVLWAWRRKQESAA